MNLQGRANIQEICKQAPASGFSQINEPIKWM